MAAGWRGVFPDEESRNQQIAELDVPAQLSFLAGRHGNDGGCPAKADAPFRHRTTMNIYHDVLTDERAQAHSKVVRMALARAYVICDGFVEQLDC